MHPALLKEIMSRTELILGSQHEVRTVSSWLRKSDSQAPETNELLSDVMKRLARPTAQNFQGQAAHVLPHSRSSR